MIFFSHIPKTGGQTVNQLISQAYRLPRCLRVAAQGSGYEVTPTEFPSLGPAAFLKKTIIFGHLKFRVFLQNPTMNSHHQQGLIRAVTIVRDPIDRVISLVNFIRADATHPGHERFINGDPLIQVTRMPANHECEFLRAYEGEAPESIVRNIMCLKMEGSDEKMKSWLEEHCGRRLKPVKLRNVTRSRFPKYEPITRADLSSEALRKLESKHSDDLRLYELSS